MQPSDSPRRKPSTPREGGPHEQTPSGQPTQNLRPTPARGAGTAGPRSAQRGVRLRARRLGLEPRQIRSASSIRAVRASASSSATERWPSTRVHVLGSSGCRCGPRISRAPRCHADAFAARSGLVGGPTGSASPSAASSWRSCSRSSRSPRRFACRPRGSTSAGCRSSASFLDGRAAELGSDVNRLGREPAIRKLAIDAGLGQLDAPIVLQAR